MKIQILALINKAALLFMITLASVLMPFDIYAAGETQIVPTWSQSSQQSEWSSKFRVTNFCESSNNPQNYSCQLTITVNGDYYGYVYFDGYINNQIIWDYQTMFISGGKGTFYYTWYANGLQQINKVNIAGLSLVSPTDNIDLSQIISILNSINNYEQQSNLLIDEIVDNTDTIETNQLENIQQIKNVISQLIVSNGYLEILTKMKEWSFPIESLPFVSSFMYYNQSKIKDYYITYNTYTYPIFSLSQNDVIYNLSSGADKFKMILFIADNQAYNLQLIKDNIIEFGDLVIDNFKYWGNTRLWSSLQTGYFISFDITISSYTTYTIRTKKAVEIIPIYFGSLNKEYVSTEFALQFGLSNKLLNDLDIIANGTSQSNQQSSDLSSGTDSMQQQMNNLVGVEDSYNQQFNNSVNSIDFSNPLQQNQGLLGASNFVITVFNGLIANNPFSILIIIVCILLIGKKVIGK